MLTNEMFEIEDTKGNMQRSIKSKCVSWVKRKRCIISIVLSIIIVAFIAVILTVEKKKIEARRDYKYETEQAGKLS